MIKLHPPIANCLPRAATDDALCGGLLALRCANRNLPAPKNEPHPNNRFPRHFDAQRPIQRRRRNGLRPSPAAKSAATTHNRRAKSARRLQRANRLSTEGPNPKAAPPSARACLAHPSTAARQTWDRPAQKARPASPPPHKKSQTSGRHRRLAVETRAAERRLIRIFGNRMPLPHAAASHSHNGRARAAIGCFSPSKRRGGASTPRPNPGAKGSAPQTNQTARPSAKLTQTQPQNARMTESANRGGEKAKKGKEHRIRRAVGQVLGSGRQSRPTPTPEKKGDVCEKC